MSREAPWNLGQYIEALVAGVAGAEPVSAARLRRIVGARAALITVDEETVHVRFEGDTLHVTPPIEPADGEGATDRRTVLDLLAGRIEITDAVLTGRLRLIGTTEAIIRMSQAIEILLDVSVRAPALQKLADRYRAESPPLDAPPRRRHEPASTQAELSLLNRLGLLPNEPL